MPELNRTHILTKALAAAAWADGKLPDDEREALADLLFLLPDATEADWLGLASFCAEPLDRDARLSALRELGQAARGPERELLLEDLETLIQADDVITDNEESVLHQLKDAENFHAETFDPTWLAMVRDLLEQRKKAIAESPNCRTDFEAEFNADLHKSICQRLEKSEWNFEPDDLNKLCHIGGLLSRVAQSDSELVSSEVRRMNHILQRQWGLNADQADFVVEAALGHELEKLDTHRLTRQFYAETNAEQRRQFIDLLLEVASADKRIADEEIQEIHRIAHHLKVPEADYQAAVAKVLEGSGK